ncbi:Vesicle coat complex AP-3, delta subunit [Handroanthus impetiginosus]|uniref:AP-3 complex subunit delta n=1 Tax=Handroanthus impetiginosus TaxID=429701 RepID=A0A2G9G9L2_9LAMI|nr:Vesicle coat complex AP-3, delta subunit [Handroanthus impetiginosus]
MMDSFFQRSLEDIIKGLRLCPPGTEPTFIAKSLDDIRREIKSSDRSTKATALQKLTYLHSIHGVDMSWAAFHSVELASSSTHSHKRIAFLSASLSFNPSSTDVILLLTHQLRKDLSSSNAHDVSLALSTLSSICNPDLCRDLTPELFTLLGSSKFFVRKKAIAVVLRVFEEYPDAVRVCFKRIVENLETSDMGILSAVVELLCELTVKEPRSYLPLAPEFYKILVDSRNNWVLIKVLKIFAKLIPLEPRLGKRVVEPICEHLRRMGAKSLAFECVRMIVTSLSEHESALRLAVGTVREFLLDDDPNLKYLGLQALAIVAQKHMWAVLENKELVVKALSDVDPNIKLEALRLVMSTVSADNVMDICTILISHALKSDPEFCNEILGCIFLTCSRNFYEVIFDFEWYVSFLGEMARIPYCQKGTEIETQLVDIGMRVKDARLELVSVARDLVIDPALLGNPFVHGVLAAAAWISGEYVNLSRNPFELMEALLQPRTSLLTPSVRSVYIQSAFKVLMFCIYSYVKLDGDDTSYPSGLTESVSERDLGRSFATVGSESLSDSELDNENVVITGGQPPSFSSRKQHLTEESIMGLINLAETNLGPLSGSDEVEIQDRASNVLGFIKLVKPKLHGCLDQSRGDIMKDELKAPEMIKLIYDLFSEELGPVSLNAQERVPLPDGLALKENLGDLEAICGDVEFSLPMSFSLVKPQMAAQDSAHVLECPSKEVCEPSSESTSLLAEHRKRHGLYYLPPEDKEVVDKDYQPTREPKGKAIDATEDLVKLTEPFFVKKKSNRVKPRPVVVKLDDVEEANVLVEKHEFKPDLLSGAVQEVLLGNEATASSSRKSSNKSNNDITNTAESSQASFVGSGRRKHHTHGKGRTNRTSGKEKEERSHKDEHKRDSRDHKHKSRQRAEGTLNVDVQSSVIPDFLL